MHNDSLLVMVAPHQRENEIFYKQLLKNKAFSVVIDTFSFALFFIRKEQEREVFFYTKQIIISIFTGASLQLSLIIRGIF